MVQPPCHPITTEKSPAKDPAPLPREFYSTDTIRAAQELLGHYLLRRINGQWCGGEIVETEAYVTDDPACHAYLRETPRNRSMWGAPGHAYVYRIYGAHFCFNAVCRSAGVAEAVLVRAIEPGFGLEELQRLRPARAESQLCSGPAKLCQALAIDLSLDGLDVCDPDSSLIIAHNPHRDSFCSLRGPVITTTRIGITKAADWPLRWFLDGSPHVSKRVAVRRRPPV